MSRLGRAAAAGLAGAVAWAALNPQPTPPAADAADPGHPRVVCPLKGTVTSGWGPRDGGFHDGVDIAAAAGSPIRAVTAGVVTRSVTDDPGGYGQYIDIAAEGGGTHQYGHMRLRLVRTGQRVTAGQVIAEVGSEGASSGPHLHLRIYPRGPPGRGVDPARWLATRGVHLPC